MDAALRIAHAAKSFRVRSMIHLNPSTLRSHQKTDTFRTPPPHVLQETRLAAIRSPTEFFDYHRISRPADLNQATSVSTFSLTQKPKQQVSLTVIIISFFYIQRISYNTRYFSGAYMLQLILATLSPFFFKKKKISIKQKGNYGLIVAVLAVYAV
jgi:hypothetical protein